jgi:hypothetical protein
MINIKVDPKMRTAIKKLADMEMNCWSASFLMAVLILGSTLMLIIIVIPPYRNILGTGQYFSVANIPIVYYRYS